MIIVHGRLGAVQFHETEKVIVVLFVSDPKTVASQATIKYKEKNDR